MTNRNNAVDALCRTRMFAFLVRAFAFIHPEEDPLARAWYLLAMCRWLERADAGELPRSLISIQPRSLKSFTVAVCWPCWLVGRKPSAKVMVATYGETLSAEHAEARRRIMESEWYQALFPNTWLARRGNRDGALQTSAGGRIAAVSVGGPVTGRGADVIILDDCLKADAATSEAARSEVHNWFATTLSTRLNDKRDGVILSIQQRICEDDLPGELIEKGYEVLKLPAIAEQDMDIEIGPDRFHYWKRGELLDPIRFPMEVLDQERLNLGRQAYSAQYLQTPIAADGNLVRMEWFKRYERTFERRHFDKVVQSWDPAATDLPTSDYSVCTTWGGLAGRYFLLDIHRARHEYPALKRQVIALRERWNADYVIIERSSNGLSLIQQLMLEGPFRPVSWPPSGIRQQSKVERLLAQTGQMEEGRVWLPAELDGLDTFLAEIRAFPGGRYDDQVDSLTQMLEWSFFNWRKYAERRTPQGRLIERVRSPRPQLPELPEWIW